MGAPNKHILGLESYNPNALIDFARGELMASSDAKLAIVVGTNPPIISRYRTGKLVIGNNFLVNLSELLDVPTRELKNIAGMPVANASRL